jgi:hypothetical protein
LFRSKILKLKSTASFRSETWKHAKAAGPYAGDPDILAVAADLQAQR